MPGVEHQGLLDWGSDTASQNSVLHPPALCPRGTVYLGSQTGDCKMTRVESSQQKPEWTADGSNKVMCPFWPNSSSSSQWGSGTVWTEKLRRKWAPLRKLALSPQARGVMLDRLWPLWRGSKLPSLWDKGRLNGECRRLTEEGTPQYSNQMATSGHSANDLRSENSHPAFEKHKIIGTACP